MILPNGRRFEMKQLSRTLTFVVVWSAATSAFADVVAEVAELIARPDPPAGVVFEIVTADEDRLETALPNVREQSRRLRERFKDLSIAVVSHGSEQFALMADRAMAYSRIHQTAKTLALSDEIPVHVCGTHAGWYDIEPEAFPDYVDVAPVGPVQVKQYIELGYVLIEID